MFVGDIETDVFGKILDYQVPLKGKRSDKAGKIDFVSEKGEEIWLVEIKREYSTESILRAILEVATYYHVIADKEKFLADFHRSKHAADSIKKVVAIFEDSPAYKQLENQRIQKFIEKLGIKVVLLKSSSRIEGAIWTN
jgi:hypothetical protein